MNSSNRSQGSQGESVWRAREWIEAAPPADSQSSRQRAADVGRNPGVASWARPTQPMPAALSASTADWQGTGTTTPWPTQVPQWPLVAPAPGSYSQVNTAQSQSFRGQPLQRPERPSRYKTPTVLDQSRPQEQTPIFQYAIQQALQSRGAGDSLTSPNIKSPMSTASRASTVSSMGSIPDFPMPVLISSDQPGPVRKSANLGPPPTARRGASSLYSTVSYVPPIQEESPRTEVSHESFASSNAMPSTWENRANDDDEGSERNFFSGGMIPEDGADSTASNGDDSSEHGLVRTASFGQRGKPSVVTTARSIERGPSAQNSPPVVNDGLAKRGLGPMEIRAAQLKAAAIAHSNATSQGSPTADQIGNESSSLGGGTLTDNSSSESPNGMDEKEFSPTGLDPRMSQILHAHQAASGVHAGDEKELERSLSRLSALRRPLKLDIDAVRDAEARGSLTSLPELIKRATRLASMIDRGSRPGSRLNNLGRDKEEGAPEGIRSQSGLSGMLSAFPAPGSVTRENSPRPQRSWSSPHNTSTHPLNSSGSPGSKPGRRCCGVPLKIFILVTLVTLLIVAAAVLVPLFLFIIGKSSNSSNTQSAFAQCQQTTPCANGGTSILNLNACSCICANGFTGSTCATASASGCTTTDIRGTNNTVYSNVTLGEAIPRLISGAKANFSIPLSSDVILARFNSANLSCEAENALVTFDGYDQHVDSSPAAAVVAPRARRDTVLTSASSTSSASLNPTTMANTTPSLRTTLSTTASPTTAKPASGTAVVSGTNSTTSQSTPPSTAPFTVTQETLDFARVAVLYILQQQKLDNAVTAQISIQNFLRGGDSETVTNVTLGDGNSIDFWMLAIDIGDGKGRVGGGGAGEKRDVVEVMEEKMLNRRGPWLWGRERL